MKTVIYIRTSTEEQNPQLQLRDCKKLITKLNLQEYEIIEDKVSGWKEIEREGFDNLYKRIKKKEINHLLCWDLDRLYRNRKKLMSFFELCKLYDCQVHSFRQTWLEELNNIRPPFNEIMHSLMLQIMGWLAEEESNKRSERVKLAIRKKGGKTYSKFGNRWGRREISTQAKSKIISLYKEGFSIREIRERVWKNRKPSLGVVHKTISEFKQQKTLKNEDVELIN